MNITPYQLAERFIGVAELPGDADNPFIMSMLRLDNTWPDHDEVPWCSAFVNYITWLCRLPRSKSLAARSWLTVGREIQLEEARADSDIVVLSRAGSKLSGHVGFFSAFNKAMPTLEILGANQHDAVSVAPFLIDRIISVRRLG